MTKKEALKIIDEVSKELKSFADKVNDCLQKTEKNPRLSDSLGMLYSDMFRNLSAFEGLKKDIENYDATEKKVAQLYDIPPMMSVEFDFEEEVDED